MSTSTTAIDSLFCGKNAKMAKDSISVQKVEVVQKVGVEEWEIHVYQFRRCHSLS